MQKCGVRKSETFFFTLGRLFFSSHKINQQTFMAHNTATLTMVSPTSNRLLPSEFDSNKVDSLIAWLKTFPQFDGLIDESVDSIELLTVAPVAK